MYVISSQIRMLVLTIFVLSVTSVFAKDAEYHHLESGIQFDDTQRLLSVKINAESLIDTLATISRLTNISIQTDEKLNKRITFDFTELPVDKALTLILRGTNRVMVYDTVLSNVDYPQLDAIYVLASDSNEPTSIKAEAEKSISRSEQAGLESRQAKLQSVLNDIRQKKYQRQNELAQSRQKLLDTLLPKVETLSKKESDLSLNYFDRYALREARRDEISRQLFVSDR